MLATLAAPPLAGANLVFEPKYDGIRALVEIDPAVIALREAFMVPSDSDRFRVVQADGADHVRGLREAADVLLLDGFDDAGIPDAL